MLAELAISGAAIVASYPAIPIALHYSAKLDLVFKQVRENSAVIVTKNEEVERVLFVSKERHLSSKGSGYDVFDLVSGPEPDSLKKSLRKFFLFGGIRFLGVPIIDQPLPYLHFSTTFKEEGGSRYRIDTHTEILSYIPMQDEVEPLVVHVTFANGIRAHVVILAHIIKKNPVWMVFGTTHWWEAERQRIASATSTRLSAMNLQSVLKNKKQVEEKIFASLSASAHKVNTGVIVASLSLIIAEPASAEDAQAVRLLYEGEQRAKVIREISQAIRNNGVAGLQASTLETLRQSDGNIVLVGKEVGGIVLPTQS